MKLYKIMGLYIFFILTLVISFFLFEGNSASYIYADQTGELFIKENEISQPQKKSKEHSLPPPTSLSLQEYEKQLYAFVLSRKYDTELNWNVDKGVRDTGPWIKKKYYGTHPAVRIFYSPKVMYWLTGDASYWPEGNVKSKNPREGEIPDGAMIIKEMFDPPAARYVGWSDSAIVKTLFTSSSPGWTVMVKDSKGSKDGWFWSSVFINESLDSGKYPFNYPNSGFGLGCLRCHASAEKEFTFSSVKNIKGFPGDPITFFVDDTWRDISASEMPFMTEHDFVQADEKFSQPAAAQLNEEFIKVFNSLKPVPFNKVLKFPSENFDKVVAGSKGAEQFITSDQCMMCHSGGASNYGNYGPIMFIETGPNAGDGKNVSPYGEWRWSPMGLAGRDPIFHAQLESELSILKEDMPADKAKFFGQQTVNTCLLCHGAMGKRQYDIHQGVGDKYWEEKADFKLDWYYLTGTGNATDTTLGKFGGLGRDGISCAVCHHIEQEYKDFKPFIENNITGQFKMSSADKLYGPFTNETISTFPMENIFGIKPEHNEYIKSSRLCGSCHTIDLPVVDYPLDNPPKLDHPVTPKPELNIPDKNPNFADFMHSIEQATYLEWVNSKFQNEFEPFDKDWQSCQDCHMPVDYKSLDGKINIDTLKTKIAFTEDESYPDTDNRKATDSIKVTFREEGFVRHRLQGLNIFLAEMFKQSNDILGVRLKDYETGTMGLDFAIENFVQQSRERTASVEVSNFKINKGTLNADVFVTNKTGHRLPSGVGFRRVFIEFLVIDNSSGSEKIIWASGRTNNVGVILDGDGNILPTEFLTKYEKDGKTLQHYQRHWETIDSQDKVQIYEELSKNAKNEFTTSFTHRDYEMKDNRLLPMGWSKEGPSKQIPKAFLEATYPGPLASKDPDYSNGKGLDIVHYKIKLPSGIDPKNISVKATLYSQAWAPYYLNQRFTNVPAGPEGDARRRLYYLASNLKVKGTPIENWKLMVASDSAPKK